MMKRILFISFLILISLTFSPNASYALISTSEENTYRNQLKERVNENLTQSENIRAEIQERIQERIKEKRATQESKLTQLRKEKIRKYWNLMEKRISATIERLNKLITRIESRIVKIKEENTDIDTSKVEPEIDKAKDLLSDTQKLLNETSENIDVILESENPKIAFEILREKVQEIKKNLIKVHNILVHIIGDIKGLRVGTYKLSPTQKTLPTSTPTTMPTSTVTPTEGV